VMIIAHHTVIAWRWDLKNKYNNNKYDNEWTNIGSSGGPWRARSCHRGNSTWCGRWCRRRAVDLRGCSRCDCGDCEWIIIIVIVGQWIVTN
jgi:hypothetical protein